MVRKETLKHRLLGEVDPDRSLVCLIGYCLVTGFTGAGQISALCLSDDAADLSRAVVWSAALANVPFQTFNAILMGIALARVASDNYHRRSGLTTTDGQALTSLLSFAFGAFIGGRIGDHVGPKRRVWLFASTVLQGLFCLAGSMVILKSRDPGPIAYNQTDGQWTDVYGFAAIGFTAASIGLQAIAGRRLGHQLGTCCVLTTTLTELVADPGLFKLGFHSPRDIKASAIATLWFGAFCGRCICTQLSSAAALGIAAGLRVIIALLWLFIPGTEPLPLKS